MTQAKPDAALKDKIAPFVAEIRSRLDDNQIVDSLIRELAMARLTAAEIQRDLTMVKAHQRTRDILLPQARMEFLGVRSAHVDAGMPLQEASGFYSIEYASNGRPYRWTGPDRQFQFDLHLDRTLPLQFLLHLASWGPATTRRLRCFADGIEIPLVHRPCAWAVECAGLLLPREVLGLTRIEFVCAETFQPATQSATHSAAGDQRALGVIFLDLLVDAADAAFTDAYLEESDILTRARQQQWAAFDVEGPAESAAPVADAAEVND